MSISRGGVPAGRRSCALKRSAWSTVRSAWTMSSCGTKPKDCGSLPGIDVLAVDEDGAALRRAQAAERGEQRGFARAAGADDADEARGGNGERDIVEDGQRARAHEDVVGADGAAGGIGHAVERVPVELKAERPDLQAVADGQFVGVEAVAVDEGAGRAVQVGDDDAAALAGRGRGVPARDAGIVQPHVEPGSRPMVSGRSTSMRSAGLPKTSICAARRRAGLARGGGRGRLRRGRRR